MKGVLFIGSGNSIASGLPSVQSVSDEIFKGQYNYYESDYSDFIKRDKDYQEDEVISKMRKVMKIIQQLDNELSSKSAPFKIRDQIKFTGSLYKGESNYEDLYFIVNEIHKSSQGLSTNSTINSFILKIEEKSRFILSGESIYERVIDLGKICLKCVDFIDWLLPKILLHSRNVGLDLIVEMANKFSQLEVVTLNHDLLLEDIFQQNDIEYDDGFHGIITMGSQEFKGFKPESKIKLIKPHGSINWIADSPAYNRLIDLDVRETMDYRVMRILTGTNKILAYNRGVFSEMFFQFHKTLKANNLMIMSGYGMGDEGINMRIGYWLQNPKNSLIILHKYPDDLIENSYILKTSKDKYLKEGRLKFISEWLSDTNFAKLKKTITNTA